MLVDPSLDDLLTKVDNKFKLVTLAMKRARQINDGHSFLEEGNAARPVSMALQEINAGQVYVKEPEEGAELEAAAKALLAVEVDEAIATIERAEEEEIERAAQELAAAVSEAADEAPEDQE